MRPLASLIAGVVFGLGLVISGLANPAKVLNFLDVAGTWDPSLAFVMAGAVATVGLGYRLVLARPKPAYDTRFHLPGATAIDGRLLAGAAVFGVGWGMAGYCPGPAITALALLQSSTLVFVAAMLLGMWLGPVVAAKVAASCIRRVGPDYLGRLAVSRAAADCCAAVRQGCPEGATLDAQYRYSYSVARLLEPFPICDVPAGHNA